MVNDIIVHSGFQTYLTSYNLTITDKFGAILYSSTHESYCSYKTFSLALRPYILHNLEPVIIGYKILTLTSVYGHSLTGDISPLGTDTVYLYDANYYLAAAAYEVKIDETTHYLSGDYSFSVSATSSQTDIVLPRELNRDVSLDLTSVRAAIQYSILAFGITVTLVIIIVSSVVIYKTNQNLRRIIKVKPQNQTNLPAAQRPVKLKSERLLKGKRKLNR
jgi:hypothetical protein